MKKSIQIIFLVVLMPLAAHARPVNIGIFNFAPWGIQENNQLTGIVWEQAKALFKNTTLEPIANFSSYSRMILQLKSAQLDCAIFIRNPEDDNSLNFISHLHDLKVSVISRKGLEINDYSDFYNQHKSMVIGFARGAQFFFSKLYHDLQVQTHLVPAQHQGPLMITRGRIDAFVGVSKTMLYEIRQENLLDQIIYPGYPVAKFQVWLQCSKTFSISKANLQALKTSARTLRLEGTFDAIIDKWIPPLSKTRPD